MSIRLLFDIQRIIFTIIIILSGVYLILYLLKEIICLFKKEPENILKVIHTDKHIERTIDKIAKPTEEIVTSEPIKTIITVKSRKTPKKEKRSSKINIKRKLKK